MNAASASATGEFLGMASSLGIMLKFEGKGIDEVAIVDAVKGNNAPSLKKGDIIVKVDPRYFRPAEVETLLGDASKAKQKLGWQLEVSFDEMIDEMVSYDLDQAKRHALLKDNGYEVSIATEA